VRKNLYDAQLVHGILLPMAVIYLPFISLLAIKASFQAGIKIVIL
jgi:hypothetical protein